MLLTNGRGAMARLRVDFGQIYSKYDCALAANLSPDLPVDGHVFVKRLRIWVNAKNVLTNLAEFEELNTEPDPPLGTPNLTTTLPDGATPAWAGPMIVQGSAVSQVYLVRVTGGPA